MKRLAFASLLLLTSPAVLADSFALSCAKWYSGASPGNAPAPLEVVWNGKQLRTDATPPGTQSPQTTVVTPLGAGRVIDRDRPAKITYSFRMPDDTSMRVRLRRLHSIMVEPADQQGFRAIFSWAYTTTDGLLMDVYTLTAINCNFASG